MEATAVICPVCLKLVRVDSEQTAEFTDYPGVVFHADCVDRKGVDAILKVLAATYHEWLATEPYDDDDEDATSDTDSDNDTPAA